MPNITPNPITVTPPKTSGGSLKNPANLIAYSAAAQGPQAELWANFHKALRDAQSQLDGIANSLRSPLAIPDPIQVVDPAGNLVANIGTYINPATNTSFSGIWTKVTGAVSGIGSDADPMTYGAIGDNTNDDTNAVQQALNTGTLYLRPGRVYFVSSTLLIPTTLPANSEVTIYGGGLIGGTANPVFSGLVNIGQNIKFLDVQITSSTAGATLITIANQLAADIRIESCFFGTPGGGASVGIAINANQPSTSPIIGCIFQSNVGTAISLTNQTGMVISGCQFRNTTGTNVSTSGTCTYNLVGCNVAPHHGAPVLNQFAEFTGTSQTITAGAGFTAVTSCSITISATGTWQISGNAFVQQASAAGNTTSIRFARNGSGDAHTAASGITGPGECSIHFDLQIALTSGDTIALQCSAVGANATLVGSGSQGTTNISGVFLTT